METIKKVLFGGMMIALANLALYGIYRIGCQNGVDVSEQFVAENEPDAYDRLTKLMNDSQA